MTNLERPLGTVMSSCPLPRGAGPAEGGRSSCGVQGSEALPSLPFVFLLGWVYFYDFFPICLFFLAFSFFPPVCMCLCVLSFRLGWESAGCSCFALTFHRKRGLGPAVQPTRTKEQGVGRNRSYPRYQDGPGCWLAGSQASETRSLSGSWGLR